MKLDDLARRMQEQNALVQQYKLDVRTMQMMQEQARTIQRLSPDALVMQQVLEQANITHSLLSETNVLQQVVEQAELARKLLPETSVLQKILEQVHITNNLLSGINIPLRLIENTGALKWAYVSLSSLLWTNIGNALKIDTGSRTMLGNDILAFSNSYFALSQSLERTVLDLNLTSSMLIFELPEVELFNGVDLLEAITVENEESEAISENDEDKQGLRDEISTQTAEALETLLAGLDRNLVLLWQGASQALTSNNVDRNRHFLISLRELFTHVLHQLAPNDEIRAWTTSPEHFDRGQPTRKARLLFICRDINYSPFSSFVEKDIASILTLWEILNRSHEIAIPLTQKQLVALKIRIEGALRLLLITRNPS